MNENQKPTTKTRIYNLIVLDKSGSMSSIRQAAFTGCNEVLGGIKAAAEKHADTQEHFASLMLFDTDSMPYILDMVPAEKITLMKEEQFIPCACTPLLDAIGMALTRLETEVKKHERALASVTIITDGYENASHEFTYQQIHQLIGRLKEQEGWNFAFMGANQDVTKVCIDLNIDVQNAQAWEFSNEGTHHAFASYKDGHDMFCEAMEDIDMYMSVDTSIEDRKANYRKMMASRSFFRRDEDK
jgi:hypothetical protein